MKVSKTEGQNKGSRKAAKKALEQSLTAKLVEAVKSLGHDAEKIGEDLILVSKFVAKKISKRVNGTAKAVEKVAADALPDEQAKKAQKSSRERKPEGKAERKKKDEDPKKVKTPVQMGTKPDVKKGIAKKRTQKKAVPTLKPIATSVKVNVVPFEEQAEPATAPAKVKRSNPVVKTTKAKTPAKKGKPASDPDTERIN